MKVRKILGMLSVWILVLACCGIPQEAMAKKNAIKDLEKQYKKEGYQCTSMAYTMYECIEAYRNKLQSHDNLIGIESQGSHASTFGAEQDAQSAAAANYALAAKSQISGSVKRELDKHSDDFEAKYMLNIQDYIMPLLQKEYKLQRKNGNYYEVRIAYTLDEYAAAKARKKAAEIALSDLGIDQDKGQSVIDDSQIRVDIDAE